MAVYLGKDKVGVIVDGKDEQEKIITPIESEQIIIPDKGYLFSKITVQGIPKNYVGSEIPKKQTETITAGTVDKIIKSGQYLEGDQIIKGDVNLTAENIKQGISILGVEGTFFGTVTVEDLEHYANVNKMLTHSEGAYDNIEYSTYYANVTENINGTISIDLTDTQNSDYVMETVYNSNGTISIDALEIKGEK